MTITRCIRLAVLLHLVDQPCASLLTSWEAAYDLIASMNDDQISSFVQQCPSLKEELEVSLY